MKISTLMREYIEYGDERAEAVRNRLLPESFGSLSSDLPVVPATNDWSLAYKPERLHRTFTFQSLQQRSLFLEELMAAEEAHNHFAKITIEGLDVTVEVWTHDLGMVTELDKEYAQNCDVLYNDVSLIRFDDYGY